MAILEVSDVTVNFGGNRAVDNVSLPVEEGSLTGLIGPNGAGKTTLFNVISGLLSPSSGKVTMEGSNLTHRKKDFFDIGLSLEYVTMERSDITRLKPHQRAKMGLARTFQRLELFTSLSVRENIQVAGEIRNRWDLDDQLDAAAETERVIDLIGLGDVADSEVSEIPTGQARIVELGRALMTRPKVLLLDEPASGQTEEETRDFGELLKRLAGEGTTVFLVEHDMALVMSVCEMIHVLDFGRIIARGTPEEIQTDQAVLEAYLGSES